MKIACLLASVSLLMLISGSSGEASDTKTRVYTNDDLDRHKTSPDPEGSGSQVSQESKKSRVKDVKHVDMETWCNRGEHCRSRIERAKRELELAEAKYKENLSRRRIARRSGKREETAEAKMNKARQKLEQAERDLHDLEQNAHRKNIPPGWLRCQFGY